MPAPRSRADYALVSFHIVYLRDSHILTFPWFPFSHYFFFLYPSGLLTSAYQQACTFILYSSYHTIHLSHHSLPSLLKLSAFITRHLFASYPATYAALPRYVQPNGKTRVNYNHRCLMVRRHICHHHKGMWKRHLES